MKFSKKIRKNVAAEPESRKWLWLQLGVGVVMTVVVATLYIFDARDNRAASKSQSDHAGRHGAISSGAQAVVTNGAPVGVNTAPAPGPAPEGMVWIPGGTFWMGCDACGVPDAAPSHQVAVDGLWLGKNGITSAQIEEVGE